MRRPLVQRALVLALAVVLLPVQAQVRLPALGESAADEFNVSTERRTGEQIMREIRRDPDYLDDPVLLEYLQAVWQPLVAAARQMGNIEPDLDRNFPFESFLVRDRSVNAFALPGGYVGVHTGLIAMTGQADELAAVLAHELSHVTQRHIARSVVAGSRSSMVGLAALILGILAASRTGNADIANAAILSGQGMAVQGQLNFSRDMEREADRMGYGTLGAAGFGTAGMATMFEKMDTANRLNDSGSFPYLRTHPLTVERMAEARSRALFGGRGTVTSSLHHALMQSRAKVLGERNVQGLQRFEEQAAASGPLPLRERLQALYAGALAATFTRNAAGAERLAAEAVSLLQAASPRDAASERDAQLLLAQVRVARGEPALALKTLDGLAGDGGRPLVLLRAQAQLDLQRQLGAAQLVALRQSTETLQTWVADHPQDAAAWQLLAQSADAVGLKLRALRAGAEAQAAIGDLNGAIDRLRAGQTAAKGAAGQDFIEASVIDARLRELQGQRRALQLEARGGRDRPGDAPPQ